VHDGAFGGKENGLGGCCKTYAHPLSGKKTFPWSRDQGQLLECKFQ